MHRTLFIASLLLAVPLATLPTGPALTASPVSVDLPAGEWIVGLYDLSAADVSDGEWRGYEVLEVNKPLETLLLDVDEPVSFHLEMREDPAVAYHEWNDPTAFVTQATPDDPRYPEQYGFPQINAPGAWDVTYGDDSGDVVVSVIDTGIDQDHPDLQGVVAGQYDFVNRDGTANDVCGHGTHVAGTVAANTDNAQGVAGTAQVKLLIAKALSNSLLVTCTGSTSDIADAITWSTDNGADVISMSLGSSSTSSTLQNAVQYAWDNGVLLVAAAGNDGPCSDCVSYPAAYPEVMAVTCTEAGETQCSFSSDGPESEIAAPGEDVLSTYNDGGYRELSGTSMSTPHVAGVAGLVLSVDSALSNQEVRDLLTSSAQDLGASGWDERFGYGEVDAQAAVEAAGGSSGDGSNSAPTADVTYSCTDLSCDFDGTGSSDSDGSISGYAWDLGDGNTATGSTVSHTYASGGTYTVTLTVTDDDGATDSSSQDISVSESSDGSSGLLEDFESGDPGWQVTDNGGSASWQLTTARSSSPDHSLALAGYSSNEEDHVVTETVALSGLDAPTLSFDSWMEGERYCFLTCTIYDHGRIQVTDDGGSSWTTLETRYYDSSGWETKAYDLSDWSDQTIQVRFSFFSDGSVQNEGWYIDNVEIS